MRHSIAGVGFGGAVREPGEGRNNRGPEVGRLPWRLQPVGAAGGGAHVPHLHSHILNWSHHRNHYSNTSNSFSKLTD